MRDRRAHAHVRVEVVGKREPKPLLGGLLPSIPLVDPLLNPILDPILTPIIGGGGGGVQTTPTQAPTTPPTQAPPVQTTAANPPSPTTTQTTQPTSGNGQSGNGQSGNGQSGNGQSGNGQSGNGQSGNGQSGNGQPGGQSGNDQSGGQSGNGQSGQTSNGNGNSDGRGGQSGSGNGSGNGNSTGGNSGNGQTGNGVGGNSQGTGNRGEIASGQTGTTSGSNISSGGNGVLVNVAAGPSDSGTSPTGQNNPPTMTTGRPSGSSTTSTGSRDTTPASTGGNTTGDNTGNDNTQGGSKSAGLAPGAIAGIVIGCLLALILAVVLVRRRRMIMQRLKRRNQWQATAVESSTYPFDSHVSDRSSLSPPPSARSSFATTYDHSSPSSPQMAELRDTHGPGTFSQRNAGFVSPLSPRSPPPIPLLIDVEKTSEFFAATSPGVQTRPSVVSTTSDPYTMGQVIYTNDNLGLAPQPMTPMSVRPFSPTEAFSFPMPPPSNVSMSDQQQADPFADSPTIPAFKPPEVIKRPFNPSKDDELFVQAGDRVSIIQLFDDGWVAVRKLEDHEGKGKGKAASGPGLIPVDCFREQGQPLPESLATFKRVSNTSANSHYFMS